MDLENKKMLIYEVKRDLLTCWFSTIRWSTKKI